MERQLRVGISGYGVVGKRRRQFIDLHPNMKTVAVSDIRYDGDGVLEDGVRYYDRYTKLADEDLDVLFVCLSNDVAADATIQGLDTGCHVFCEKPPGRDLGDIARVVSVAKRRPDLKLKYGFNHRYHDSVRDALAIIRSGQLGKIVNLRGVYGKSGIISFGQDDWRSKRAIAGGGILLDQGIHMVDLMRLFVDDDFADIRSFVSNSHWGHDVEDNAYALMRTQGGVVAMLHSTATQWRHRFKLEVFLERGAVNLSGILSGSKSYGAETLTVVWSENDGRGDPREQTTRYNNDPSWAGEIAEFAEAVIEDKQIKYGSADDALRTMHLVFRIYCADPEWRARWNLSDEIPDIETDGDLALSGAG